MKTATESLRQLLDELGVRYDEQVYHNETMFLLDYNEHCGDYMNSISVIGECVTYSQHYLSPATAVFLAGYKAVE